MKNCFKVFLTLALLFTSLGCEAQSNEGLIEIKDTKLNYILGNLRNDKTKVFNIGDYAVTVYIYSNISGSANIEETHQVTDNLIFTICEYGETFNCKSYETKNYYAPKNIEVKLEGNMAVVSFTFINLSNKGLTEQKSFKIPLSK